MVICNFGDNLREIREGKEISQKKLAEMLSVSKSIISKWENGKIYPQVRWVYEIADKLNVNPKDLL